MATSPAPGNASPPAGGKRTDSGKFVEYDRFIDSTLRKTRTQVRNVDIAAGVMLLAAGTLAFFLLMALLDHWVVPGGLGPVTRWLALILFVAGAAIYSWRSLLPLLLRRINPVYAAHSIERSKPSLKNSLVNFLLLRANPTGLTQNVFEAIEEQAATNLAKVPLESTVDRSKLIKIGYVFLAVLLVAAIYKVVSPKDPLRTVGRVVLPWADIDPPTRVRILAIAPGDATVFRGRLVRVTAEVQGLPGGEPVTLSYSTADGQLVERAIAMRIESDGYFYECQLPEGKEGIQQDLAYRIVAGDAVSHTFHLTVEAAPTIVVESIDYRYPEYTGLVSQTTDHQSDIKGIEGTQVTVRALANQPIKMALIDFDCNGSEDQRMTTDDRKASVTFTLALKDDRQTPEHASYQLTFTNVDGQESVQPIRHQIEVTPDVAPEIQFLAPKKDEVEVPLNAALACELAAGDPDFALARVSLVGAVAGRTILERSLLDEVRPGQFVSKPRLSPKKLGLKDGDVLDYWAWAEDNKSPVPNRTETPHRRIRVVSPSNVAPDQDEVTLNEDKPNLQNRDRQAQGQPPQDQQNGERQKQDQPGDQPQGENQDQQEAGGQDGQGQDSQDQQGQGQKGQGGRDQDKQSQGGADRGEQEKQGQQNKPESQQGKGQDKQGHDKQGPGEQAQDKQGQENQGQGQQGADEHGAGQQQAGGKGDQQGKPKPDGGQQGGGQQGGQGQKQDSAGPVAKDGSQDGEAFQKILDRQPKAEQKNKLMPQDDPQQGGSPTGNDQNKQIDGPHGGGEKPQPAGQGDKPAEPSNEKGPQGKKSEAGQGGNDSGEKDKSGVKGTPNGSRPGGAATGDQNDLPGAPTGEPDDTPGAKPQPGPSPDDKAGDPSDKKGDPFDGKPDTNAGRAKTGEGAKPQPDAGSNSSGDTPGDRNRDADQAGDKTGQGTRAKASPEQKKQAKPAGGGQPDAKGGDPQDDKGQSGAGRNDQDNKQGSPEAQNSNTPRNKTPGTDKNGQKRPGGEPPSPSGSRHQSDSKGQHAGDQSGGGGEGGGQEGNQPGTGGAGQNSASDEGGGAANQHGDGETADRPGKDREAPGKTGSAGDKPGKGSSGRKAETKPGEPGGKPDQAGGDAHERAQSPTPRPIPNSPALRAATAAACRRGRGIKSRAIPPHRPPPRRTRRTIRISNSPARQRSWRFSVCAISSTRARWIRNCSTSWVGKEKTSIAGCAGTKTCIAKRSPGASRAKPLGPSWTPRFAVWESDRAEHKSRVIFTTIRLTA